jgi:mannose-6-phosphate isomerase-like protein (cupin superfamily)
MAGQHRDAQARRVVVGYDDDGKSAVLEDGLTTTRLAGPGNTKCDIWRVAHVPAPAISSDGLDGRVITAPPSEGLSVRVVTFPPDSEWDRSQGYSDANGPLPGSVHSAEAGGILGLHSTNTLDILTVVAGEIYVVLECGETLLHHGDVLVMQAGAKHAWSNKTSQPVTVVTVSISTTLGREAALPRDPGQIHVEHPCPAFCVQS